MTASSSAAAATTTTTKIRREWYQSPSHVFVSVFAKNVAKENVVLQLTPDSYDLTIKLTESNDWHDAVDRLFGKIDPGKSEIKHYSVKVELCLAKAQPGLQWDDLTAQEDFGGLASAKVVDASATESVHESEAAGADTGDARVRHYPSSSKRPKDWGRFESEVVKETAEEKLEGDAALMKLFRDIYDKGDDNTKKAMLKSFQESGGTVLSTNWNEVGTKHVDAQAPKGMEARKWSE